MSVNNTDITDRAAIEKMVRTFYGYVLADELLSPKFSNLDMEAHFPTMFNFWASMLLHDQSYHGNPFDKHLALDLKSEHFTRWLQLFEQTVDELFEGPVANEAKSRANSIAGIFQHKLGLI